MNAEIFAEWLRRQGYQVLRTQSSYWYNAGPRAFQAFPFHWLIQPGENELKTLTNRHAVAVLRYSTPLEAPLGMVSYHAMLTSPDYSLETIDRRARQNVKKGLNHCRVERISMERMAEEGWELEQSTAQRQQRANVYEKKQWRRRYLSAADLPGFEVWGALSGDQLVASILAFQMDDCCELISQQCHRDFLTEHVNHALTFTIAQEMIHRPGINSIFYSLQSLDAPPSVDEYKFRMGFTAKPVRQRILFHPALRLAVNPFSYQVIRRAHRFSPQNHTLTKAEGMFRFYLSGQEPLDVQEWPAPLEQYHRLMWNHNTF